jgi:glutamyl/glutaminyl-tRNA synthetase
VFDEAKLSWVNRHYLKALAPRRLAAEAIPFLAESGIVTGAVNAAAYAWLEALLPGIAASVDRLNQLPDRLHSIFTFDAAAVLTDDVLARELAEPPGRSVVSALAEILADAGPLVDRDAFRAAAVQVRERTGARGRALFHPIRVALTGAAEGPELDLLVPAIDGAASLAAGSGLQPVVACRQRAAEIVRHLR